MARCVTLEYMNYRIISGDLEAGQDVIELKNSPVVYSAFGAGEKQVIFLAWNYETGQFDVLSAEGAGGLSTSTGGGCILGLIVPGIFLIFAPLLLIKIKYNIHWPGIPWP